MVVFEGKKFRVLSDDTPVWDVYAVAVEQEIGFGLAGKTRT